MIRMITDSTTGIPPAVAKERGITIAPLYVWYDDGEQLETAMDIEGFYDTLEDRIDDIPSSSQPSQHLLEGFFEEAAAAGDDVLGVFISGGLSGTFEGAVRAARTVKSHNIGFRCVLIDSLSTCADEVFPLLDGADARDGGGSLEECAAAVVNGILCSRILFVPESLAFLKAGGRIGPVAALMGSAIKITPVISVFNGVPQAIAKVRTMKRAVNEMLKCFQADVERYGLKRVVVHYIGKKTQMLESFHAEVERIAGCSVEVRPASPVIGVHVGPAVGLAYECVRYVQGKLDLSTDDLIFTA